MEPVLVLLAEWWWVAPAAAGAGALGVAGVRHRGVSARRLELEAALHDVRQAQDALTRARARLKLARAEMLRAEAERSASMAPVGAVLDAKRGVHVAHRTVKAAVADLRARRAFVRAARATMPASRAPIEAMPLARLRAEHDQLTTRWMAYETDPAKAIDVPVMSDASSPALQAFLREQQQALELRPSRVDARMAPADFAAYRDAVRRATHAFDAAERAALHATGRPASATDRADWRALMQELMAAAQIAITSSAEAWQRGDPGRGHRPQV